MSSRPCPTLMEHLTIISAMSCFGRSSPPVIHFCRVSARSGAADGFGLTTEEIARASCNLRRPSPSALSAKRTPSGAALAYETPRGEELRRGYLGKAGRYLIFNEGYTRPEAMTRPSTVR